jgi:peptidoglycan/xylan/chitin deacetylase (PgdA/CDA1 family)
MRVALTFDTEHPSRPHHPAEGVDAILDVLGRRGVPGTFFLQGRWVRSEPRAARRIADEGHEIGNHSHHHAPMDTLTDDGLRHDVVRAQEVIADITGVDPRPWFRCPFGAGMDDPRVLSALGELGYEHVGWDVDPEDWEPATTPEVLRARVLDGVHGLGAGDAIVLLHGWPQGTLTGLDALIGALEAEGAGFAGVAALRGR